MTRGVMALLATVVILAGIGIAARMQSLFIGLALPGLGFALGMLLFDAMRRKAASELAELAERVEPRGPSLAP
jgi:Na+-translocating ferredoxin:NAD+ oxidoreductase RnfA subunit